MFDVLRIPLILVLAAEPAPAPPGPESGFAALAIPGMMLLILWYFVLIRPQSRERKKREDLLGSIKKDDKVITIGGIIATVANVGDEDVTLKVDDGTRIKFRRSSIQEVVRKEDTTAKT